eukprot:1183317-Amphidinium_carterae.1
MPELATSVAELLFIPISERVVEGQHSLIHRTTQLRTCCGAYISVRQRRAELQEALAHDSVALLRDFQDLADADAVAARLHLAHHPHWLAHRHTSPSLKRQCIDDMLYVRSPVLQFSSVEAVAQNRKHAEAASERCKEAWVQSLRGKRDGKLKLSNIVQTCMTAHMKKRLAPGMLCSLPVDSVSAQTFHSLAHAMAPVHKQLAAKVSKLSIASSAAEGMESDIEVPHIQGAARRSTDLVFFRVVSTSL